MKRTAVLLFCLAVFGCSQWYGSYEQEGMSIITYNVQDLFDARYDGGEYPEYDPREGLWDAPGYHLRLSRLRDVIARSGYPDVVLLQEIEKPEILDDLVSGYLYGRGYHYRAGTSTGTSAIELGVITRFPVTQVLLHEGQFLDHGSPRPTMEVVLDTPWGHIHVFNAHWKSKIGGAEVTEPARRACAEALAGRIADIRMEHEDVYIIAGGDFNTTPFETGLYDLALLQWDEDVREGSLYITAEGSRVDASKGILYSPWLQEGGLNRPGTYVYRGEWEAIDHLLFCGNFFTGKSLDFQQAFVIEEGLLDEWGSPAGWNLNSREGYSDHLPLGAVVR